MTTTDPDHCASLVRSATDDILATPVPTDGGIEELIRHVRDLSQRSAERLRAKLASLYPGIGWVDEEGRPDADGREAWVYDPIDGAYHYLQGLPLWSSSLALVRNGVPILAIIYDPTRSELFTAAEGFGARLNGTTMVAAAKTDLRSAVLGTAVAPILQTGADEHARALALFGAVSRNVFVVRQMASASLQLAYVAAGRLDGYWEVGDDTPDWLAGSLMVHEAGGTVTDLSGRPFGSGVAGVLAASRSLHPALLGILTDAA